MAKKLSLNLPPFYSDPLYQKTQDILFPFGEDLLAGQPNEYYAPIGETGSPEFENMLALTNRDTSKAVSENLVRRGISRGGLGLSIAAKTAADTSTKLRWEDYLRAMTGKEFLLSTGSNMLSNVLQGALSMGGQKNQYNISKAELSLAVQKANQEMANQRNAMWGQIAQTAIGLFAAPMTGGLSLGMTAMGSANPGGGKVGASASVLNPEIMNWGLN